MLVVSEVKLLNSTLKFPQGWVFAGGEVASKDFHTVLLSRREGKVICLKYYKTLANKHELNVHFTKHIC